MRRGMPVAEEAVGAHDADDQPPIIPRYDPTDRPVRQVYTGQQVVRQGGPKGNVIYLKSTDGGTQKMMVRKPSEQYRQDYASGSGGGGASRMVAVRTQAPQPPSQQQVRQIYTGGGPARYLRVQGANQRPIEQQQQVVRRVVQQRPEYMDQETSSTPPPPIHHHFTPQSTHPPQYPHHSNNMRYVLQNAVPHPTSASKMARMLPRGGMTMQMVQQAQNPDHRRLLASRAKQKVTTYRDFMASRGYLDASKFMYGKNQTKPTFLPFEFNEEEEREINEAIAREEEWMRLEEENKMSTYDSAGNPIRTYPSTSDATRGTPYVSNLLPSSSDSSDDKVIKQVLDVMFSQVCRWDRQYGWSKTHMKRARQKNDNEKIHLRKARLSQREVLISEHMDRLKKEINKRRTKMENEAEQQCGMLTPWRKSRARPNRSSKPKNDVKKEVINPADITLGGDTYDYNKDQKPFDSIASGVSRRRRTSANLSKSEDDNEKSDDFSTRGTKQSRTSESPMQRVTFYAPGVSPADIDMTILHCTCQQPFDPSKCFISCDMCARWYHTECVGITEKMCITMEQWTCDQCVEEQERVKDDPAVYCICKKPYDDTKFYVGCDSCQGWFHPECVGTTREDAEKAAEYNCPECSAEGYDSERSDSSTSSLFSCPLTRADYATYISELLELLINHRMSTPFRNPVDPNENPDYERVIKKPIDLAIIAQKVENTEYLYLGQFVNDVNLMFENAKTYNPKDNAVFKCAETIQEVFDKKLYDVREQIAAHQQMLQFQQQHHHHDPMSSARKRVQSESQRTVDSLDIDSDQLLPLDANLMSQLFDY